MASNFPIGNGKHVLFLDAEEAGFLKDLLCAHVAGRLTLDAEPLGRIRKALMGVNRRLARKSLEYGHDGYAVLESYGDDEEEAYDLNRLYDSLGGEDF